VRSPQNSEDRRVAEEANGSKKGLPGRPPRLAAPAALAVGQVAAALTAGPHSLAGNALGYGATGGTIHVAGRCGQRLGIRNSGATIIAEGAGKYAFEYMTGGRIIDKGLSAKPEDRYSTLESLLEDLEHDPEEVRRQQRLGRRRSNDN
jgi:hypothetical protein